jgi:hypothetical protein
MGRVVKPEEPGRDVRFGSKADICAAKGHVRFTPESGHWADGWPCTLCAKSGHSIRARLVCTSEVIVSRKYDAFGRSRVRLASHDSALARKYRLSVNVRFGSLGDKSSRAKIQLCPLLLQ